jgi:hypothetical protein
MVVRVNIQLDMLHFRLPVSSRVSATMLIDVVSSDILSRNGESVTMQDQ